MSAFVLKLIALVSMVTDHTAALLVPLGLPYIWMRSFGRMAFLIYAFLLSEGFHHTRSVPRYARRLFLMGALSQIPYAFTLNAGFQSILERFTHLNIFFTLGCGVLLMMFLAGPRLALSEKRGWKWGLVPLGLMFPVFGQFGVWELPYILTGLLAIAALGLFLRDRLPFEGGSVVDWALKTAAAMALYQLLHNWSERLFSIGVEFDYSFWALLFFALLWPCRTRLHRAGAMAAIILIFYPPWYGLEEFTFALLAGVLVVCYNGKRGPDDHRLFYWAYPAHLAVLWGLQTVLK